METTTLHKEVKEFHGKDLFLLGKDEYGTYYYLESPSWDCGWYWGFGYIEGFTNNRVTDRSHESHQHATSFVSEWFTEHNGSTPRLTERTFTDKEGWQLSELFKRFYILKESAELFGRGGAHVSSTDEKLKREAWASEINETLIPQTTAEIIKILTPRHE